MASGAIGTPKMIVPFEWIVENVEEEPMAMVSKMVSFRGEKVFRVGLKNRAKYPVLFLMAIDLRKLGMRVEDVKYGIQGSGIGPATMDEMMKDVLDDEENLQLFSTMLADKVVGNHKFSFRICIVGTDSGYSYQLCDRLAKDQLFAALINQQWTDVEFIVKDKTIPSHKAILAARSPVFADKFEKKQPVREGHHQIRIDSVEPSTVEKFLYFIYTGEAMGTLADEELLKLADYYQVTTLSTLCQRALRKIDEALQIVIFMKCFNNKAEEFSSSKITPEKETEILCDRTTPTFRCKSKFEVGETEKPKCVIQYQNYSICIAYLTGKQKWDTDYDGVYVNDPVIHLSCIKHRSFGVRVEDIYCEMNEDNDGWVKMESQYFQENLEHLHLTAKANSGFSVDLPVIVNFDIKVVSTIGNYYYEMMDKRWLKNFWAAATSQMLTDVEIFVGIQKVMEAHRVILSARSLILNASLKKISNTKKSIVTFGAEFDIVTVKHFLKFLYTGFLKSSDHVQQLGKLAEMYQVETLKNVCQLLDASPPDAEKLTDYLLQL